MRRSKRADGPVKTSKQSLKGLDVGDELTSAWKALGQSKAALRQIENKLEAGPGTGVSLEPVLNPIKNKSFRKSHSKESQQGDHHEETTIKRGHCQHSPEKSSSRSPLSNCTQDNTIWQGVEFMEPVASYREATPPPHPSAPSNPDSLNSVPGSSHSSKLSNSNPVLSNQRDTGKKHTDIDLASTHSSLLENMEVCYLNDQTALDILRTNHTHTPALTREIVHPDSSLKAQFLQNVGHKSSTSDFKCKDESTPSSSPGSASQRLENLRRHQPDDKLEKLKERIRKQRQHLEDTTEKEKLGSHLEQPVIGSNNSGTCTIPTVKVRKVATAPSAPIYKGFNSTETKIQTPDGKIWNEEEFHNLSREFYKDLSQQFTESTKSHHLKGQRDQSKERKHNKPVRKVQKVVATSYPNAKPGISPASWREGQKLVKMVLGKDPRLTTEESRINKRSNIKEIKQQMCLKNTAKKQKGSEFHNNARDPSIAMQEIAQLPVDSGMSADIKGMLDDLQLQFKTECGDRARPRSRRGTSGRQVRGGSGSRTREPVSTWATTATTRGSHSASPSNRSRIVNTSEVYTKKRHYDADSVRLYMTQQQEKRKKQQAEEKKALKEETEKRHQRLQELYKKQRTVTKTTTTVNPAQIRLQETFNKLVLEGAELEQEATQMRPIYQPSGESDKENIRLEKVLSPSSSDQSLNYPPISRNNLDYGKTSSTDPENLTPMAQPVTGPICSNEHLLSHLLRLESALAASEKHTQKSITAPRHSPAKTSRIESLKATATSLSNRIENEARKLAGEGINYGLITALDVDSTVASRSLYPKYGECSWSEMAVNASNSYAIEDSAERNLGTRRMYSWTGLPGHDFNSPIEKNGKVNSQMQPHTSPAQYGNYSHHKRGLIKDGDINYISDKTKHTYTTGIEVKHPNGHDISSESISEGPLSEGSFTDGEQSPPHSANAFRPIGHLRAVQHSGKKSHKRLSEFQKDAGNYATLSSLLTHQENPKPAWEEFNKGSPLSVINIFTNSLQGNAKVHDMNVERNSPSAHLLPSSSCEADLVYENDFVSPQNGGTNGQKDFSSSSNNHEESLRRSSDKPVVGCNTQSSSCSTPNSSPHSKNSTKRSKISDQSDVTLVEEHKISPFSEALSSESRNRDSKRSSEHSQATLGDISGLSHQSSKMDENMSPPSRLRRSSNGSLDHSSSLESKSFSVSLRRSSAEKETASNTAHPALAEIKATGDLQYSPAVLQQRLAAELHYLESIEESVRQLGDIERLMGVSMAQHESASLTQMLMVKQQQHEQELYELKIKSEREALETKLQMEENRQRVVQAQIELQEGLAVTQKESLEGLQEATTKMMSQQAEASRYAADTARHIKEMTEMAHAQLKTLKYTSIHSEVLKENSHANNTEKANERFRTEEHQSTLNSYSHSDHSDSASFRRPGHGLSLEHKERMNQEGIRRHELSDENTSRAEGIEEEVPTELNESLYSNSIPSAVEEKGDTTSVATEYSHKFDESVTEDEIEERSFRSLLPSEAHRRESLDKKTRHHDESEEDGASHNSTPASVAHNIPKPQDVSATFSGGQASFSHFTMEMVRQYMRDEEVRLQHQSALLQLRQKALKEKTRAELAWLEHQKKKLRDKGEDDKMPPIKKKQRGLLLKLQQEQTEIKRLQEANKAARKERLLLLKQQEEIERMRSSTLKLKERLRCATTEALSDTSLSEVVSSNLGNADPDVRSPSPSVSVSGSETSSIMQKLKKMRSQMDEKFLTKREQQLMQRRHHAEELLQWKRRLDQEEAEVLKMEKKALEAWDDQTSLNKGHDLSDSEKDHDTRDVLRQKVEADASAATPDSSIHTDVEGQDESLAVPKYISASETASSQSSPQNYSDDFTSVSCSSNRQKPTFKDVEVSGSSSEPNFKDEVHNDSVHLMPKGRETTGIPTTKQTEPISDQSDIESRIKALKEELKKRKFTVHQLKKEQKKRTKERLKAQEANLLKQLETYNDFIERTKAELNGPDSTQDKKSHITDQPNDNRSCFVKISEPLALVEKALQDRSRSPSMPSIVLDKDSSPVTPTQRHDSSDGFTSEVPSLSKDTQAKTRGSQNQNIISEPDSEILEEEINLDVSKRSEDDESKSLLKVDQEKKMDTSSETRSHRSQSASSGLDQGIHSSHPHEVVAVAKSNLPINKSVCAGTPTPPNGSSDEPMQKETSKQDKASTPLTHGYLNSFESSVGASLREKYINLKSTADSDETSLKQDVDAFDSSEEEIKEEKAKELSEHSLSSKGSQHFSKLMDDQYEEEAFRHGGKSPMNCTRSASVTPPITDEMPGFNIGDRVVVSGVQPGTLKFKGATSFANGFWAGVELDKSEGSNNGTYDGVLYFQCTERHGIFAPPNKVTHLTDKFEIFTDTTEDDDSFNDDMSEDEKEKRKMKESNPLQPQRYENELIFSMKSKSGDNKVTEDSVHFDNSLHNSQNHGQPITNGKGIWDSEDMSLTPLIENTEKVCSIKQGKTEVTSLVDKTDVKLNHQLISSDLKNEDGLKDKLGSFSDKLLNTLVKDTVQQFAEIKKSKAKKINDANEKNGNVFDKVEDALTLFVDQKDGLPFFITQEKDELSSPELYKRPESPVLGASGQEELAKRLAELELSRGLDEFGDDQDWFDEDYGLSSRREQQRLKQRQRDAEEQAGHLGKTVSGTGTVMAGVVPSPGDQQVKTPPRPELPLPIPPKLPEEPAMVVPHSAAEIEKMVQAATLEIWESCGLNRDETMTLTQQQKPHPSSKYFDEKPYNDDQETVCLHSYKKAVFDLTWEILQDIFAEDPNANQPQWVKPQRVNSSFQRVRTPGDISTIQEFVTTEVLKLYGLTKHQDQQTDWPKMLKFGRKKRDRVDNILVQELHEEESQWVNYDEDELFVKMQLADSIFDALIKDTADVLTQIYNKRSQKGSFA